jgi:hypothetical protein
MHCVTIYFFESLLASAWDHAHSDIELVLIKVIDSLMGYSHITVNGVHK